MNGTNTGTSKYRVVCTTVSGFTPECVDTTVTWQGDDTTELSRLFPPSDVFGADRLGHREIEDGYIRTDYRFEKLIGDEWQETSDPRVRLTPVTPLERAIDDKNRRDFPGDYDTADCYNCNDFGCQECEPDGIRCTRCGDNGCAKCLPNATCKLCYDNGCDICDPVQ